MAKKKDAVQDSEPKKAKFENYVRTERIRAKLFEIGDEDGFSHISGFDASKATSQEELIPYVEDSGDKKTMHFGQGYIVIDEQGNKSLMSKAEFNLVASVFNKES